MRENYLYHITSKQSWKAALACSSYQADSLAEQGFIHCSTSSQVIPVANRFYHGVPGLVLLEINPQKLNAQVRWENLEGGNELFPHIYGPLNLEAVSKVTDFSPEETGEFFAA